MRALGLATLVLAGCADSAATPPGPLAAITLDRSGEPVAAAACAPERFEANVDVCGADPFAPAKVRGGFSVRRAGPAAWLDAVSAELRAGSPGLAVVLGPRAKVGGAALTPDAPWVGSTSLAGCARSSRRVR